MKTIKTIFSLGLSLLLFYIQQASGYNLPGLNLGETNILDGGPLRPTPGWYSEEFLQNYHASKLLNGQGTNLGSVPSPTLNQLTLLNVLIYQSDLSILFDGKLGFSAVLPVKLSSKISQNLLGYIDCGAGFGDFEAGVFLQWHPENPEKYPVFVHRLQVNTSFPTGKYKAPTYTINPGAGFMYFDTYWAATLFFTPDWAVSGRFYYLWNEQNKTTHVKAGDAVHANFDIEYQLAKELWVGPVGYYLKQLRNSTLNGVTIPDSCEQVLGLGPGVLYSPTKNLHLFTYLYFENYVKNRAEGVRVLARFIYYFG